MNVKLKKLPQLLNAKKYSDKGNYGAKQQLLRQLLDESPDEFRIDGTLPGDIIGLTHLPTRFRIHAKRDQLGGNVALLRKLKQEEWQNVPSEVDRMVAASTEPARAVRAVAPMMPRMKHAVFFDPDAGCIHACLDANSAIDAKTWQRSLSALGFGKAAGSPYDTPPEGYGNRPWVLLKRSYDPTAAFVAKALNFQPSMANALIGGPSPLAATLSGGLLGAGLGYAGGTVAGKVLPDSDFDQGAMARNGAIIGGLAGTLPGLLWGATAHTAHPEHKGLRAWLSGWPFRDKDTKDSPIQAVHKKHPETEGKEKRAFVMGTGADNLDHLPMINPHPFHDAVWQDHNTPIHIRAATTGLVETAAQHSPSFPFVTPYDVARIAGAGAKGLVVGKVLGAMAGLNPQAQRKLQQEGVWAELLTNVVPHAYEAPYHQAWYHH